MSNLDTEKTYALVSNPLNKKLISKFREAQENVLIFPSIKAEKIGLKEIDKTRLKNLTEFDWIILTDIFTVDYFIEALRELEIDLFELDVLRVCALGEAVADRLRFARIHSDIITSKIENEAVFSAISEYLSGEFESLRFLVLRENSSEFEVSEKLVQSKAKVAELTIYQARFEDETANIKLKTLLKGGAVDEFIFSSAEDLESLKFLFPGEKLTDVLKDVKVSAMNETVFQNLLENGLRPLYFHPK